MWWWQATHSDCRRVSVTEYPLALKAAARASEPAVLAKKTSASEIPTKVRNRTAPDGRLKPGPVSPTKEIGYCEARMSDHR
jgi:hypothetical protein